MQAIRVLMMLTVFVSCSETDTKRGDAIYVQKMTATLDSASAYMDTLLILYQQKNDMVEIKKHTEKVVHFYLIYSGIIDSVNYLLKNGQMSYDEYMVVIDSSLNYVDTKLASKLTLLDSLKKSTIDLHPSL